jgi:arylsulfatase
MATSKNSRSTRGRVLVSISACCLAIACTPAEPEFKRLNVVLIVLDTLRAANLSLHGYARATTPNLDRFAKQNVYFRNAISVGGNTTTAMAGIMTGRSPFFEFGTRWNDRLVFGMNRFYESPGEQGLPANLDTLAEKFQRAGYTTVGMITNPYLKRVFNFHKGFDAYQEIFDGNSFGHGEQVSDAAIGFLESVNSGSFFLYLHYMDVHGPYQPPDDYRDCFGASPSKPRRDHDDWKTWDDAKNKQPDDIPDLHRRMTDLYDCSLRYLDDQVARVLASLGELGLLEQSIVVVTSDHGEEFLEHGGTTHKGRLFGEFLRVPLIIHVPGQSAAVLDALVRNFDLMPTLLELAGIEHDPQVLDALSLQPLLQGKPEPGDRRVYANFPLLRAYRDGRYKILESMRGKRVVYDLLNDPKELHPLSGNDAQRPKINALQNEFVALVRSFQGSGRSVAPTRPEDADENPNPIKSRSTDLQGVDEATLRQLRALGYAD